MSEAEDTLAGVGAWKSKYYDSLEDLDRKEKQWSQVEDLLRMAISRLSLAADGLDKTLDRQLESLRNAIRDRRDNATLRPQIEAMSATLLRLENERSERSELPTPSDALSAVLEQLPLPRGYARKVRAVKKTLAAADASAPLQPLVDAFSALLGEVLQDNESRVKDTDSPGLLGRLLGKRPEDNGAPAPEATAPQPKDEGVTPRPAVASQGDARDLLLSLLDRFKGMLDAKTAKDLRTRTRGTTQRAELLLLGEELAGLVTAVSSAASPAPGALATAATGEVMLQLLERLELPAEYGERVAQLQDYIESLSEDGPWDPVLCDIAAMVAETRSRIQDQKKELEEFLVALTGRLQDIDDHLQGSESARKDSQLRGRELDANVQEQVRGIASSVEVATDLDQIKQSVQVHVEAIVEHMSRHMHEEEQRHQDTEQEVEKLRDRLQVMELETENLRDRVREERRQALTDALTGIPNRLAWGERVEQEVARWKRFQSPLSLLVWDVDFFKRVNDGYGHKAGDKVLCKIASLLNEQVRETDFFARLGGEEFGLLMTGSDATDVMKVADKLRASVEECGFHFRGERVPVTISCGIACFAEDDTYESVFERADKALYKSKDAGRNRCEILM